MRGRLSDACAIRLAPRPHRLCVGLNRPAQAVFTLVRFACRRQRRASHLPARHGPLSDALSLHVSHLSEHRDNQLPHALGDAPKSLYLHRHTLVEQLADRALYVDCIPAQPVHCIHMQSVALPGVLKQLGEARPVGCEDRAGHSLVREVTVELSAI